MTAIFNFQFGEFESSSPNWFDWLSLFISVGSIFFAFYLGEMGYKRDKKDKKEQESNLTKFENELFKSNLETLHKNLDEQIKFLEEYIKNNDFRLVINSDLQVNFIQNLDYKYIYGNGIEYTKTNRLINALFSIKDIKTLLGSELDNYIKKYNILEKQFKNSYRQILHSKYYEYSNRRAIEYRANNGRKEWKYDDKDMFMEGYSKLKMNSVITNSDNSANHELIINNIISPLIEISNNYIPEDYDAIEINNISNDAFHAYGDMEYLTINHFRVIDNYLNTLISVKEEIKSYLDLYKNTKS